MKDEKLPGYKKVNTDLIEIRDSGVHGKGVFAARDIKKGEKVIEYVGELISKDEAEERCDKQLERSKNVCLLFPNFFPSQK